MIITHSAGGLFLRWVLSNPTLDHRYIKILPVIRWVVAIAPSNLGTPVADIAMDGTFLQQTLGWLLGYNEMDSVKMQEVLSMAVYNQQNLYGTAHRPSLPVPFYNIAGTDVHASPFNTDDFCNVYKFICN